MIISIYAKWSWPVAIQNQSIHPVYIRLLIRTISRPYPFEWLSSAASMKYWNSPAEPKHHRVRVTAPCHPSYICCYFPSLRFWTHVWISLMNQPFVDRMFGSRSRQPPSPLLPPPPPVKSFWFNKICTHVAIDRCCREWYRGKILCIAVLCLVQFSSVAPAVDLSLPSSSMKMVSIKLPTIRSLLWLT